MPEDEAMSGRDAETVIREDCIDAVCDRYEDLWIGGKSIPVVDFLRAEGINPDRAAPTLIRELGRLEAHYANPDATRTATIAPESGGDAGIRAGPFWPGGTS